MNKFLITLILIIGFIGISKAQLLEEGYIKDHYEDKNALLTLGLTRQLGDYSQNSQQELKVKYINDTLIAFLTSTGFYIRNIITHTNTIKIEGRYSNFILAPDQNHVALVAYGRKKGVNLKWKRLGVPLLQVYLLNSNKNKKIYQDTLGLFQDITLPLEGDIYWPKAMGPIIWTSFLKQKKQLFFVEVNPFKKESNFYPIPSPKDWQKKYTHIWRWGPAAKMLKDNPNLLFNTSMKHDSINIFSRLGISYWHKNTLIPKLNFIQSKNEIVLLPNNPLAKKRSARRNGTFTIYKYDEKTYALKAQSTHGVNLNKSSAAQRKKYFIRTIDIKNALYCYESRDNKLTFKQKDSILFHVQPLIAPYKFSFFYSTFDPSGRFFIAIGKRELKESFFSRIESRTQKSIITGSGQDPTTQKYVLLLVNLETHNTHLNTLPFFRIIGISPTGNLLTLSDGQTLKTIETKDLMHKDIPTQVKLDSTSLVPNSKNDNHSLKKITISIEKGHLQKINLLEFSPDANYLASASIDGHQTIWDTHTWKELNNLNIHKGLITQAIFHPNRNWLLSISNTQLLIWDFEKDSILTNQFFSKPLISIDVLGQDSIFIMVNERNFL